MSAIPQLIADETDDDSLLDAYSKTVAKAAERVGPARRRSTRAALRHEDEEDDEDEPDGINPVILRIHGGDAFTGMSTIYFSRPPSRCD